MAMQYACWRLLFVMLRFSILLLVFFSGHKSYWRLQINPFYFLRIMLADTPSRLNSGLVTGPLSLVGRESLFLCLNFWVFSIEVTDILRYLAQDHALKLRQEGCIFP